MEYQGIALLAGNSNLELAKKVAHHLRQPLGKSSVSKFANDETSVTVEESVRNKDVYILQSISCPKPNDYLMELLVIVDAVKRASASRVTAVIPYLGYAIQDKKDNNRSPIVSKLIASLLQRAGVDRVIAVDLHSPVTKGFWDIPVENISMEPAMLRYIRRNIFRHLDDDNTIKSTDLKILREKEDKAEKIVVSPDEGGTKRTKSIADKLGLDMAIIYHKKSDSIDDATLVGNVEGKVCIDDMVDTCSKLKTAANVLKEKGALDVHALCTHGLFSGDALKKLAETPIVELVVTNTISHREEVKKNPLIKRMDISAVITEAIRRQHFGEPGAYELELQDTEW